MTRDFVLYSNKQSAIMLLLQEEGVEQWRNHRLAYEARLTNVSDKTRVRGQAITREELKLYERTGIRPARIVHVLDAERRWFRDWNRFVFRLMNEGPGERTGSPNDTGIAPKLPTLCE